LQPTNGHAPAGDDTDGRVIDLTVGRKKRYVDVTSADTPSKVGGPALA
jgi:hypothetical protein